MPVSVEKLPDEPIIVAKLWDKLTSEDIRAVFVRSAALMADIKGNVYRITDFSEADATFPELLKMVSEGAKHAPGTSNDPRVKVCFVGSHAMGKLYVEFLRKQQFGAIQIPMHKSMEIALESVRIQIANEQPTPQPESDS